VPDSLDPNSGPGEDIPDLINCVHPDTHTSPISARTLAILIEAIRGVLQSLLGQHSKLSLIQTNWEQNLVQISESPNYISVIENMFKEVIKFTSLVSLGNTTLCWNLDCRS
jgi:N-dimethylarginine dimethylaminohydrolase